MTQTVFAWQSYTWCLGELTQFLCRFWSKWVYCLRKSLYFGVSTFNFDTSSFAKIWKEYDSSHYMRFKLAWIGQEAAENACKRVSMIYLTKIDFFSGQHITAPAVTKNMLIDLGSESNVSSLITKRKMQRVFKLEPRFPAIQFSLYFVIGEQKTVPQFCQKVFSFWTLGH